jgi:hypothetical protein
MKRTYQEPNKTIIDLENLIKERDLEDFLLLSNNHKHLECDGFCQVLALEMRQRGYEPKIFSGYVKYNTHLTIHQWIVMNEEIYDYRLQMWFGDHAPFGIISLDLVEYVTLSEVNLLDETVIQFMAIDHLKIIKLIKN